MKASILVMTATALVAGSVHAQSSDFVKLAQQCTEFIANSDTSLQSRNDALIYANALEEQAQKSNAAGDLTSLLPDLNNAAADCVAFARQIRSGAAFDPQRNRYVPASSIAAEAQAALRQEQERRAAQAEAEAVAKQEALEREVNRRVFDSCSELSETDSVAAFTNAICVQSFKVNGLPER